MTKGMPVRNALLPFEILDGFFVLLGRGFGLERAEVPTLPGLRIFLSRIQTVTRFQFPDHVDLI